jgi:hypothetical protein
MAHGAHVGAWLAGVLCQVYVNPKSVSFEFTEMNMLTISRHGVI